MKKVRVICALLICAAMLLLTSCKNTGGFSGGTNELKVGVSGINGVFNPFYAESEADVEIVSQMFMPIQIRDTDNTLDNHAGGISYEYAGDNGVKYTVSIRDDLFFSDGTNVKIDDVIFFYYFISDASYDGTYSEWYLNDIEGLKEFYFDDKNYESSISDIEYTVKEKYSPDVITKDDLAKYLAATSVEGKFDGSLDSKAPDGSTWREYISKTSAGTQLANVSDSAREDKLNEIAAAAEAELNPNAYNASDWYRENLYSKYIKDNYSDGIDVNEISGIKKINDYTCTVLFNSRNINAVSQLNALLVPKAYYTTEYVKGDADKVKSVEQTPVSSGPYMISEYEDNRVVMTANEFYPDFDSDFKKLTFVDLAAEGEDAVEAVTSGKVDIVTVLADKQIVNSLSDKPVSYQLSDCDYYTSIFYNANTITDSLARKALMGLCDVNSVVESSIGNYYTRLFRPLSVRFAEYPKAYTEPFYNSSALSAYEMYSETGIGNFTAYFAGTEDDFEYQVLNKYKELLAKKNIGLDIVLTDEQGLSYAVESGKADLWIENVYDGATSDKYDYYNSNGMLNKTGINSALVDAQTKEIRSSVGFVDKIEYTDKLLNLIMEQAIENPLYQRQTVTVYNTEKISKDSLGTANEYDGYIYLVPSLKSN